MRNALAWILLKGLVTACDSGPEGPPVACNCAFDDEVCAGHPLAGDACSAADEGASCGERCIQGFRLECEDGEWVSRGEDDMCG